MKLQASNECDDSEQTAAQADRILVCFVFVLFLFLFFCIGGTIL